jgi:hypothetical protein
MKIPKGQSEGVNRRTDNIMAKRTNKHGLQKITQKTKDRATVYCASSNGDRLLINITLMLLV